MEHQVFRGLLLFAAVLLAVWAFGLILLPFIVPIAWALCLCATTAKPYRWMATRWRKPRLAAFIMVLLTAAGVLVPMVFIGGLVIEQANQFDLSPTRDKLEEHLPTFVSWADETLLLFGVGPPDPGPGNAPLEPGTRLSVFFDDIKDTLPDAANRIFQGGAVKGALSVLLAPFFFLFGLLLTLITQYFVYREAGRLRRLVIDISPLEEEDTDRVLDTLRGTTAAGIIGGLLVAIIQGALGGVMFAIADISSPAVWAIVMAAFSLLPFGGTALVWVPAGVYLLFTGSTFGGWFVLVFGTVIVGSADNFLRPWVLTKTGADDIHPMMLFFAILSGIGLFGVSGIVFGPLLLALLTTMVQIYREHWGPGAQWLEEEEDEERPSERPSPA
ncbi:MAG: AI-2E family transporter [Planctomycetota bacterium]|nr:AI-2E family transporter [Planctomycetota bacterium]